MVQTSKRELRRQQRNEVILYNAEQLFLQNGIDNTTMNDIAIKANIGIATLFRYFPKKELIIVEIATGKVKIILDAFKQIQQKQVTCYEKIACILDFFIMQMNTENAALPKILDNFINYTAISKDEVENMCLYTDLREEIFDLFKRIVTDGQEDGSINDNIEIMNVVPTMMGNFAVFTFKLSLKGSANLLEPNLSSAAQLDIMKTIFLEYLKP